MKNVLEKKKRNTEKCGNNERNGINIKMDECREVEQGKGKQILVWENGKGNEKKNKYMEIVRYKRERITKNRVSSNECKGKNMNG